MFWSGETLKERLPLLNPDFNTKAVDCNAWTLTIGNRIYKTPTAAEAATGTHTIQTLQENADFPIPPGQFAYLETKEHLHIPNDAMGFISIKADIKLQGLINVSGFHIDPGFSGHLVFTVYNAGPAPIHLQQGQPCFLVWLASLDKQSANVRQKPGKRITGSLISAVAGKIQSVDDLTSRLTKLEQEVRVHHGVSKNFAAMTIAVAAALIGAVLGAVGTAAVQYIADRPTMTASPAVGAAPQAQTLPHQSANSPAPSAEGEGQSRVSPPPPQPSPIPDTSPPVGPKP